MNISKVMSFKIPIFIHPPLGGDLGGPQSQNYQYLYLSFDFSEIWNTFSHCHCKVIQFGWNRNISEGPLFLFWRGGGNFKMINTFIYRSIFLKFGTLFLTVIARWFNSVETKISERGPYSILRGGGNQKSWIFLYTVRFLYNLEHIFLISLQVQHNSIGLKP